MRVANYLVIQIWEHLAIRVSEGLRAHWNFECFICRFILSAGSMRFVDIWLWTFESGWRLRRSIFRGWAWLRRIFWWNNFLYVSCAEWNDSMRSTRSGWTESSDNWGWTWDRGNCWRGMPTTGPDISLSFSHMRRLISWRRSRLCSGSRRRQLFNFAKNYRDLWKTSLSFTDGSGAEEDALYTERL